MSTPRALRVAIVGAGPAGLYAADHLTFAGDGSARVDLFERLPVPFGLLRYGVAPDHLNIKAAGAVLQEVLERPDVALFCNVEVGRDLTVEELRSRYDAVIYAVGARLDRTLGIAGEHLPGSSSATSFVDWYNGHPECEPRSELPETTVVVVGVGNVALDVARLLLKDPAALAVTDLPQQVLEVLRASRVTDVHLLGRRGPEHAKFTTKELRELGELDGVEVVVRAEELPVEAPAGLGVVAKRNLALLRQWAEEPRVPGPRRLHLHFGARPTEILGEDRVSGVRVEVTTADGTGTGRTWDLPAGLVLRSVGYRPTPVCGIPFDELAERIPSQDSRVLRDAAVSAGEYAVGWAKRGATGVLGTNRSDAEEAVASLQDDAAALLAAQPDDPGGAAPLLAGRGLRHIDLPGVLAVLAREQDHGRPHGRGRVKIATWDGLLQAATT